MPILDESITIPIPHQIVVNTRSLGYEIYLDPATDKELVFHHGYLTAARKVTVNKTMRSVEFAHEEKPGFFIETISDEDYKAFHEAFNSFHRN